MSPGAVCGLAGLCIAVVLCGVALTGKSAATAADDTDAGRARQLVAELVAELGEELNSGGAADVSAALERSKKALSKANARALPPSGSDEHSLLLARNAWIWAQIARDTRRGKLVLQQAGRIEEELSELRAQLSRTRAVVEQARARVGRASQALLEATGQSQASPKASP